MSDENKTTAIETVHPDADGFKQKVTPKSTEKLFLFKCTKEGCGGCHFRHAGYVTSMVPILRAGQDKTVHTHDYPVQVCVKCRSCYAWINEQAYDVTDQIDLQAWEKAERELHKATGPGGQC